MYTTESYNYGENGTLIEDIAETIYDDYNDAITENRKVFVGITESNNRIDKAFACYIKQESPNEGTPFCVEGNSEGASLNNTSNRNILTSIFGIADNSDGNGCMDIYDYLQCNDGLNVGSNVELYSSHIYIHDTINGPYFYLCNDGTFNCN